MTNELDSLMNEIKELLQGCNWPEQANWFAEMQKRIGRCPKGGKEYMLALHELQSSLAGMGSFSDLPLKSNESHMSVAELRHRQWALAEKLAETIDALLRGKESK